MAEKRLDIKVAASAVGVEQTAEDIRKLTREARKAQESAGGGSLGSRLRSVNQQAQGLGLAGESSLFGLAKGAGAALAVREIGQSLQKLPDILSDFRASVANGDSGFRAFGESVVNVIPVVGDLRKGILDAADAFDDLIRARNRAKELATEAETRRNDVLLGKTQLSLVRALRDRNKSASDEAELIGLDEFDKARKLLARNFNEFTAQFDKDKLATGVLPDDRKAQALAALEKRWDDEVAIYTEKSRQITAIERDQQNERAHSYAVQMGQFRQFVRDSVMDWKVFLGQLGQTVRGAFRNKFIQSQTFTHDMMGMRAGLLGELGPEFAAEAERAKVQEDVAARRLDIQRRLNDPLLDSQQKTLLEQMFKQLPALQREMLSNIGSDSFTNRTQLESSRFLTGGGRDAQVVGKNTDEMKRFLKLIYEFLIRPRPDSGPIPSFLGSK